MGRRSSDGGGWFGGGGYGCGGVGRYRKETKNQQQNRSWNNRRIVFFLLSFDNQNIVFFEMNGSRNTLNHCKQELGVKQSILHQHLSGCIGDCVCEFEGETRLEGRVDAQDEITANDDVYTG